MKAFSSPYHFKSTVCMKVLWKITSKVNFIYHEMCLLFKDEADEAILYMEKFEAKRLI